LPFDYFYDYSNEMLDRATGPTYASHCRWSFRTLVIRR
jgi:hypothetical protein